MPRPKNRSKKTEESEEEIAPLKTMLRPNGHAHTKTLTNTHTVASAGGLWGVKIPKSIFRSSDSPLGDYKGMPRRTSVCDTANTHTPHTQ